MKIYAFDVDETLEVGGGPVTIESVVELHSCGHAVGLCGNYAVTVRVWEQWHRVVNFLGPMEMPKDAFLRQLKTYVPCEEVIMVGNVLGVSGSSDDAGAAQRAGVRFIKESDFATGAR